MKDLKQKAMIVSVKISRWSGRKFDRKVTSEVNQTHGTTDAGRFNKILVDKDAIAKIQKAEGKIRKFHTTNTLPWGDNGDRVLPATNYFQYTQGLKPLVNEFNDLSDEFVKNYQRLVADAQRDLNGLFNASDYPTYADIQSRFGIRVSFQPMPDVEDFRLSLVSDTELSKLEEEIGAEIADRHSLAIKDLTKRAKDAVAAFRGALNRIGGEKSRFSSSLVDNIQNLADIIPSLNYTNDPTIAKLANELKTLVVDPSALKNDVAVKDSYVERAKQLDKMFF